MPAPLTRLITAEEALRSGLTKDRIRQHVRSGRWLRMARGVYLIGPAATDARSAHIERAVAATLLHPHAVIGFASAALIHGLPVHRPIGPDFTLCVPTSSWAGRRGGIVTRRGLPPSSRVLEWTEHDLTRSPVLVTSPIWTWLLLASRGTLADGLVTGDAGLRDGHFTRNDLMAACLELPSNRGSRILASSLMHLDERRESALESQSWAYLVRHRVPLPDLQVEIRDDRGHVVARVDVMWPAHRIIGEIDGRMKYQSPDDLYLEKRREDRLREMGFTVVRWGWVDLRTPTLAHRLSRLLQGHALEAA